ncbi:MFS transporter [Halanaeroarchaeum sulfurireducens]|uniref:Major facilitator superfamily transporter n=1 Tax=Halanaeroarchaeum sulfurireducens TaxID=1604004 RepID=A0A0F7PDG0_9EURY|nr:MFS transporter [Halanaeroarchaeum sulfurireducens]AKH97679.1 major facilitator superfamily transporter [Halanaeroarchaeum sulfurireducens]ALG82074.1 major facilitator superfamily transporter [Halanaeroarchaeum sulfurireducens]
MSVERSWLGVGAVGGWQVVASSTYYSVFAATAAITAEFQVSQYQIGILLAVMTLGYTLMLFPAGAIVDGYGDRVAMVLGLGLLATGALTIGFTPTYEVLLIAVFILGASYASAMPATNRAIAARAPKGRYNLAIGVKQVGVTMGSAIASVAVTNATRVGGTWRTAFFGIGTVAGVVAVGYLIGYRGIGGSGSMELPNIRGLRSNRTYVLLTIAGFFIGSGVFTTTGYLVPYLGDSGTSVQIAGFALATMQVSGSAGRIGVGELADRLPGSPEGGAFRVMLAQMGTAAALFIALPLAGVSVQFVLVAILGVSMLGVTGLYHGTLVRLVPDDETGAATAGGQTTLNLGGLVAPPAFGLVADAAGFRVSWRLLAVASLLSAVALWFAIRSARDI